MNQCTELAKTIVGASEHSEVEWNLRANVSEENNYVRLEIRFRRKNKKNAQWNFAGRIEMTTLAWNSFVARFPDKLTVAEVV